MNIELILFKVIYKPWTSWAAYRALDGRNRSRNEPERGRFTSAQVDTLIGKAWQDYEKLAPDVPQEPTFGSRMNVQLAALTLSFFRNLTAADVQKDYAIELIADVCWQVYRWWGSLGSFARLLRTDTFRNHTNRVREDGSWPIGFPFNPPGYLARYVPTDGGLGFDVIRCPVAEYLRTHGASDLAVSTWCMLDYALADMLRLRLVRTGTLAACDKQCDFRWFPANEK